MFSVVRVEPGEQVDPDGTIPIVIDVTERPLHSVDVGAAYSTDLGVNGTVGWHHRNLFGNAEQLNLTAGIQLGGNAVHEARLSMSAPSSSNRTSWRAISRWRWISARSSRAWKPTTRRR